MPEYRRWYVPGGTFFFTLVTLDRRPMLCTDTARCCLREAIDAIRADWPVQWVATVLLPDHLHAIWTLPSGDMRYPVRWKRIKEAELVGLAALGPPYFMRPALLAWR